MLSNTRRTYIMAKALLLTEGVLDAEKDIRYRESSDLQDVQELLQEMQYAQWVPILQGEANAST